MMRESWIYGHGRMAGQACELLVEMGFRPRRVTPRGGLLNPAQQGSATCPPALVLMLVCDDYASQAGALLRRLRRDGELCDVPLVAAVDSPRASALIPALDADEVIVHPLRIEELAMRIARARHRHGIVTQDTLVLGSMEIDLAAYEVRLDGEPLELTHVEYQLLELFATHPRRVYTREHLLSRMSGREHGGATRTIDGHVGRLRAKLGPEHARRICTVRNVGYRFEP